MCIRDRVIARQTELESLGEELRVLYVAFTRAKEKLIITGCIKDEEMLQQIREIYCGSNRKALNFKERAEAKTFLELSLIHILKHIHLMAQSMMEVWQLS